MTEEMEIAEETQEVVNEVESTEELKTPEVAPKRDHDRNWDEAREVMRLQKQRIEELEGRFSQQKPVKQDEPDDVLEAFKALGVDKDDYLTAEKALGLIETISDKKSEKKARQIVQEYVQQQAFVNDEQRMRDKYEDFDYAIENYAIPMIKNDPALAHKIKMSKNPAETAYRLAKLSDEYEGANMEKQTSPKAEKIMKNSSRPASGNAAGSTLKSQADDFSKTSPQDVWSMSQKFARGA